MIPGFFEKRSVFSAVRETLPATEKQTAGHSVMIRSNSFPGISSVLASVPGVFRTQARQGLSAEIFRTIAR
ncbi:MAG: hypothetical protein B6245_09920 [Desulfobacteraceae bacterium 4572_88]|nr:MAG: hypothetical protein B6245_09920 [Desulfobacteraceae bacterium 4572_88]